MLEAALVLLTVALPLMGSPGPATLSSAAVGSAYGVRGGLPYVLGISSGTATVIAIVASGVTGVVFAVPGLLPVITAAAVLYILYLAWKIATAPVLSQKRAQEAAPSFVPGYLLAIANPKAYAALGAIYTTTAEAGSVSPSADLVKFLALAALAFAINGAWLLFGSAFTALLSRPGPARIVNAVFAVLLVASVALALLG